MKRMIAAYRAWAEDSVWPELIGGMALMLLFTAAMIWAKEARSAEQIVGRASVIDGDTIEIGGQRIRLHGIDAPEGRQSCQDARGNDYRCGTVAANALDDWLSRSRPTRCEERDVDRYKRVVAQCWRADGVEVNAWLVRNGHALDWPRYSKGAYAAEQRQAEASRAGVWQGRFQEPWEYRRR